MFVSEFIKKLSEISSIHWTVIGASCLKWTNFSPQFYKKVCIKLILNCPMLQGKWELSTWITFSKGTWRCSPTLNANVTLASPWFSLPLCNAQNSSVYSICPCSTTSNFLTLPTLPSPAPNLSYFPEHFLLPFPYRTHLWAPTPALSLLFEVFFQLQPAHSQGSHLLKAKKTKTEFTKLNTPSSLK